MIVHMNVCDFCGSQTQIQSGSFCGLYANFYIAPTIEKAPWPIKYVEKTFCNKQCLMEFFKENVNDK